MAGRTPKKAASGVAKRASKRVARTTKPPSGAKKSSSKKKKKKIPTPRASAALLPPPSPSERLLAACGEVPTERSLTDEEREAMAKVSATARRFVGASDSDPIAVVRRIAVFLDDVRLGRRDAPRSQDVRLGLGVLWGEQLRAQVGWRWVHLTYPDGFASYALVPDDRAFACFPLNRVPEALKPAATDTSAHVFDSIRKASLPPRKPDTYLVIG